MNKDVDSYIQFVRGGHYERRSDEGIRTQLQGLLKPC